MHGICPKSNQVEGISPPYYLLSSVTVAHTELEISCSHTYTHTYTYIHTYTYTRTPLVITMSLPRSSGRDKNVLMLFIVLLSVVTTSTLSYFQATFLLISSKLHGIFAPIFNNRQKTWLNFWYQNQNMFEKNGGWCCGSCQAPLSIKINKGFIIEYALLSVGIMITLTGSLVGHIIPNDARATMSKILWNESPSTHTHHFDIVSMLIFFRASKLIAMCFLVFTNIKKQIFF